MQKPSGWLTAVCITAIVLGSLGILNGLGGVASLAAVALQDKLTQRPASESPVERVEMQPETPRETQGIDRWTRISGPLMAIMDIVVSVGLLVGAIQSLRMRPGGRTLLLGAFWAAAILGLALLVTITPLFIRSRLLLALGFIVVAKLAEVAFYVFGAVYLCRRTVRALFGDPADAELAGDG